jgi:hypothetical protein
MDVEYEVVWTAGDGWLDPRFNTGRGALLPEYNSATTLTEATQGLASPRQAHDSGPKSTQIRYGPEERTTMRRQHKAGLMPTAIAKRWGIPLSTVKHVLYGPGATQPLAWIVCETCQQLFKPGRATQRFCSVPCVPAAKHQAA